MGPITFDVIEVGDDRMVALRRAQAVRDRGIRADLTTVGANSVKGCSFRLMVRGTDGPRAREAIDQQIEDETNHDTGTAG